MTERYDNSNADSESFLSDSPKVLMREPQSVAWRFPLNWEDRLQGFDDSIIHVVQTWARSDSVLKHPIKWFCFVFTSKGLASPLQYRVRLLGFRCALHLRPRRLSCKFQLVCCLACVVCVGFNVTDPQTLHIQS